MHGGSSADLQTVAARRSGDLEMGSSLAIIFPISACSGLYFFDIEIQQSQQSRRSALHFQKPFTMYMYIY